MVPFIFDFIIFGFLTLSLTLIITFWIQFARRGKAVFGWPGRFVYSFVMLGFIVVLYGSFIEPNSISVTEMKVDLTKTISEQDTTSSTLTTNHLRIALVSDLHVGPYKKTEFVEKAVAKINEQNPDVILLAGDFIYGDGFEKAEEYLAPLKDLKAPLGVFAVLGNHDYLDHDGGSLDFDPNVRVQTVVKALQDAGITILKNEAVSFNKGGTIFALGGVDEVWTNRASVEETFSQTPVTVRRLLLAHNPDIVKLIGTTPVDLVMAGHTHGGQIRLPFIGPVPPLPTELGRHYDEGAFDYENFEGVKTKLLITRGIGESGPRARLFAPPEIMMIEVY